MHLHAGDRIFTGVTQARVQGCIQTPSLIYSSRGCADCASEEQCQIEVCRSRLPLSWCSSAPGGLGVPGLLSLRESSMAVQRQGATYVTSGQWPLQERRVIKSFCFAFATVKGTLGFLLHCRVPQGSLTWGLYSEVWGTFCEGRCWLSEGQSDRDGPVGWT